MGWKVMAAVGVATLAAAPTALAKKPPPPASQWAPGYEIGYTETVRDAAGNVVSQTHRDGIPAGERFGTADVEGSGLASATQIDAGSNLGYGRARTRAGLGRIFCAKCANSATETPKYV